MSPRSVTTWSRLEPRTRDVDMFDGLRNELHDPLWLLGRQWQTGELDGDDAGSLIDASITVTVDPMARFRPGGSETTDADRDVVYDDPASQPPLETLVESETVRQPTPADADDGDTDGNEPDRRNLRLAAEAGSHYLRIVSVRTDLDVDVSSFPTTVVLDTDDSDSGVDRFTRVVGGRTLDGDALYDEYAFDDQAAFEDAARDDAMALPDELDVEDDDAIETYWQLIIEPYREWYEELYAEPTDRDPEDAGGTWNSDRLEYEFAVSTGRGEEETVFEGDGYEGGRLDWFAVDVDHDASLEPTDGADDGPDSTEYDQSVVPGPTTFPGMPADRWWEFEDDGLDFSALEASPEDLSRLLLLEYALVFGNDWFTIPTDLPVGSLARVTEFELETSFNETITVDDAVIEDDDETTSWNMYGFRLDEDDDGDGDDDDVEVGLFLPPVVEDVLESETVESVTFARDELANVGWAIETAIEGAAGQRRDRHRETAGSTERSLPRATTSEADIAYQLSTDVPANWFPLLPRREDLSSVRFDRGRLYTADGPSPSPEGRVLADDISLPESELPRTGKTVDRSYAVTRWTDGSTHLWSGRRVTVGRGKTDSGLAFDQIVDPRSPDEKPAVGDPSPFPDAEPLTEDGALAVRELSSNTPGGPRENLDQEYVVFENVGGDDLVLDGWTVADAAGHRYTFAESTVIAPGATLTLRTGDGEDTDSDRYWGRRQQVWNQTGDTVSVYDADDGLALRWEYPPRTTNVREGSLRVAAIAANVKGNTWENLDQEYVVFENDGIAPLDISGWRVEDQSWFRYEFPKGTEIPAGDTLTLVTGAGDDTDATVHWGLGRPVWNKRGDTVSVYDDDELVLEVSY